MDAGDFEQLAMPLFDSLYGFAHWLAGNRTEAEDLVQETYVKALKGFSSYRQGTNFRAWIYRILHNTFLTSRSGLAAKMTSALEDDPDPDSVHATSINPETMLLQKEALERMVEALAALPVAHREIILLCDMEELSYREAADILSVPMGTVMSRLSRARRCLRRTLEQQQAPRIQNAL